VHFKQQRIAHLSALLRVFRINKLYDNIFCIMAHALEQEAKIIVRFYFKKQSMMVSSLFSLSLAR
jgi:hypothetical protein